MPDVDIDTALDWRGRTVVDRDGKKIGTFDELFLDEDDRPAWAGVTTGLFGRRQTFVPLAQAERVGDDLRVPYDEQAVKDAPNIDPAEQLSADEEAVLYEHYGMRSSSPAPADSDAGSPAQVGAEQGAVVAEAPTADSGTEPEGAGDDRPTDRPDDAETGTEAPLVGSARGEDVEPDASRDATTRSARGEDVEPDASRDEMIRSARGEDVEPDASRDAMTRSARGEDVEPDASRDAMTRSARGEDVEPDASRDAMTRSEEEVVVGTRTRVRGRARLKKYVVTEHVQKTVPVQREEVRVEFEPTRDDSDPGPQEAPPSES
jgi:hypothetical protein